MTAYEQDAMIPRDEQNDFGVKRSLGSNRYKAVISAGALWPRTIVLQHGAALPCIHHHHIVQAAFCRKSPEQHIFVKRQERVVGGDERGVVTSRLEFIEEGEFFSHGTPPTVSVRDRLGSTAHFPGRAPSPPDRKG